MVGELPGGTAAQGARGLGAFGGEPGVSKENLATTGREVRLCCVTRPDDAQQALLEHLGVKLPERLGRPTWVAAPVQLAPVM